MAQVRCFAYPVWALLHVSPRSVGTLPLTYNPAKSFESHYFLIGPHRANTFSHDSSAFKGEKCLRCQKRKREITNLHGQTCRNMKSYVWPRAGTTQHSK